MRRTIYLAIGAASLAGCTQPAAQPLAEPFTIADIPGTYELVERKLADGRVLKSPEIAAILSFAGDHQNLNLFIRQDHGTIASESSIIRYTLDDSEYCEWIEYTTRKDLDAPGVTNQAPPVADHCTPIRQVGDTVVFAPPGESVSTVWSREGLVANIPGQFVDRWRRVE